MRPAHSCCGSHRCRPRCRRRKPRSLGDHAVAAALHFAVVAAAVGVNGVTVIAGFDSSLDFAITAAGNLARTQAGIILVLIAIIAVLIALCVLS